MSMNDLISDLVTRVKNANMVDNPSTIILKSNVVTNICKKLTTLGYIEGFEEHGDYELKVNLKEKGFKEIKRVSKPGQRVHVAAGKTPRIIGGIGHTILSTSQGLMTHLEAKDKNTGGEVLFYIY